MEIHFSLILIQLFGLPFGGDKGGDSTKFHLQICHLETSVFDVHIFVCTKARPVQQICTGH